MIQANRGAQSSRCIFHADLDAFYAAVEQLDNPELRGKPVLVGGRPETRGVVATASYEARKYGVHSAMPMAVAVRLCPECVIVRPSFDRYQELSRRVMDIFHDLTDLMEPLSLDEAYLDCTSVVGDGPSGLEVATDLKDQVNRETGLTLSVGVATSKSVAKIASDLDKPNGLVIVPPGTERAFLAPLAVGKLVGIGPKTVEWLLQEGIETIGQLANQAPDWYIRRFGKRGGGIRDRALGEDMEQVHTERATKSVSAETTFPRDIGDPGRLYEELAHLAINVARHLESKELRGRTVMVKLRLADFTTFTRQATMPALSRSEDTILELAWRLLSHELTPGRAFRLLGVGVSAFGTVEQLPLPLFEVPDRPADATG